MPAPQAVLWGLGGVIFRDSGLQYQLTCEVIQNWGIVFKPGEYRALCLNCSEAEGLRRILETRGRAVNDTIIAELLQRKYQLYRERLLRTDLVMPGLIPTLQKLQQQDIPCGLVAGDTPLAEVQWRLEQTDLWRYFRSLTADHAHALQALEVNDVFTCLAIESAYPAILAAQSLGLTVLALPTQVPFHMLHRRADWVIDHLGQMEWEELIIDSETNLQPSG